MTELPGGLLAQRFGGCRVLGFGVLLAGLLNLAFPFICELHYGAAAVIRAIQGLALVCNVEVITCTDYACQFVNFIAAFISHCVIILYNYYLIGYFLHCQENLVNTSCKIFVFISANKSAFFVNDMLA